VEGGHGDRVNDDREHGVGGGFLGVVVVGFECGPKPKLPQISCETDAWDLQPPPFPKIAEEEERRKMEVAMHSIMHACVHS
jgi:hypothetical protein